jgi:SsrA-binding protein
MAHKKKKRTPNTAIVNRRASFDYALGEELVTGIVLTGVETRAARDGHVQLKGSFVTIRNNELWLNNASFSLVLNTKGEQETTVDTSPRKLLAHRKQIEALDAQKQSGQSIVPLRLLTKGRHIKLVIALGTGKKNYDKRQTIKLRDQQREAKVRL